MTTKPPRTAGGPRIAEPGGVHRHKKNIRKKIITETKKFLGMAAYLWVLFFLFSLHERIVLAQHQIDYEFFGIPLVSALVLAKVMLIAEDLHLGERFEDKPLIYPILYKSLLFAAVFICFHVLEDSLIGISKGKTLSESVSSIGGGGLRGIVSVAAIITFALCPFFAFRELGRVIGQQELRSLLLTRGRR
jgi:hypothetical protein